MRSRQKYGTSREPLGRDARPRMLERLAAYFLNTYVAEYVGNVVTDQLTIGWRGESIVQL